MRGDAGVTTDAGADGETADAIDPDGDDRVSFSIDEPVVELRFASDGVRCEVDLDADAADALAEALQNRPTADTLEREVDDAE